VQSCYSRANGVRQSLLPSPFVVVGGYFPENAPLPWQILVVTACSSPLLTLLPSPILPQGFLPSKGEIASLHFRGRVPLSLLQLIEANRAHFRLPPSSSSSSFAATIHPPCLPALSPSAPFFSFHISSLTLSVRKHTRKEGEGREK